MHEFAPGLFIRASALVTVFLVLSASVWLALKKLGLMRLDQPFNAGDLRTWPFSFAIMDAVFYGSIFATIQTTLGDSAISVMIAAFTAALIALHVVPAFISRNRK